MVALLILAVFLLPVVGSMYDSDEVSAASDETTFKGIIEYNDELIKEAEVHLAWTVNEDGPSFIGIGKTNELGEFIIVIEENYDTADTNSIEITCTTMDIVYISGTKTKNAIVGNIVDLEIIDITRRYVSTPEITLLGTIKYEGTVVKGAKVTLIKEDVEITFTNTDSRGVYEFKCKPGTYLITVERGGFFDPEPLEYTFGDKSNVVLPDIYLTISPETTYLGLDLPHVLTLFGLFMALILLLAVVVYVLWIRRHPGQIRIIDDSPEDE